MEVLGALQWAAAAAFAFAAASRVWVLGTLPSSEAPEPLWLQEEEVRIIKP